MEQEFDKHIKSKMEQVETTPPADLWDRLEGKLNAFEKPIENQVELNKVVPVWRYAAAAAVVGIAFTFGFAFLNQTSNQSFADNELPDAIIKQDIQIGEELNPSVNVINVAEIKPIEVKKSAKVKAAKKVVEEQVSLDNTLVADNTNLNADESGIPVFALKLNAPKTSAGMNDKIKVISGEPMRIEVDEDMNRKQILIHQRLKLSKEYNKLLKGTQQEQP